MKLIKLTQGKFAMVDDEDYDYLMQWKWCAIKNNNTYYVVRSERFNENGRKGHRNFRMHRLIMKTPKGMVVDHIDHDGLNNQKYNLRNCTTHENHKNVSASKKSTSPYLGVSKSISRKSYGTYYSIRAHIRTSNGQIYLGTFKTEIEAARAYNDAAIKHHGEFANLNKI